MTLHHIPVCPFSQRVEILLALKGLSDRIAFKTVDITRPRDPRLLEIAKGTTALPVLEIEGKTALKESMVILRYVEALFPDPPVARNDPHEHALESLLVAEEGGFTEAGYAMILNRDPDARESHLNRLLDSYRRMDAILAGYAPGETFFFDRFGWAETVFTSIFQRFWFLDYYEGFVLPDRPEFDRVRRWRAACLAEPAARQVTFEEIVTLYYDYAIGCGNGELPEGRTRSSFVFDPPWDERPMPPRDKWGRPADDRQLGLFPG